MYVVVNMFTMNKILFKLLEFVYLFIVLVGVYNCTLKKTTKSKPSKNIYGHVCPPLIAFLYTAAQFKATESLVILETNIQLCILTTSIIFNPHHHGQEPSD